MSEDNDAAASYALAFEEAGRALDGQERSVNELRSRAGVLIAAAAITTSFFGARAVTHDLSATVWCAVVAFALVGAMVLFVLWPRSDWQFSASATDLIATYIEAADPATLSQIHRDLALHRSASYDRNARQLGLLFAAFRVGLILLVVEVGAWMIALGQQV